MNEDILGNHKTLAEAVKAYEAGLIQKAFTGTRHTAIAAERLGISRQLLDYLLSRRHKDLAHLRGERKRRRSTEKEAQ
jgi:hypothetical protein